MSGRRVRAYRLSDPVHQLEQRPKPSLAMLGNADRYETKTYMAFKTLQTLAPKKMNTPLLKSNPEPETRTLNLKGPKTTVSGPQSFPGVRANSLENRPRAKLALPPVRFFFGGGG